MGIGLLWCSVGEKGGGRGGGGGLRVVHTIFFCRLLLFNCCWMNKRKAKKKLKSELFCKWHICTLGWLETTKYKVQKRETPISVPFLICSLRFFLILSLSVSRPIGCCSCRLGRYCKLKRTFYLCFFFCIVLLNASIIIFFFICFFLY